MADPFVANSHILHRTFAAKPARVTGTNGIRLVLESGQEILDASAGPSVSCLGHSRPDVAQAVARQLTEVPYVYSGSRFTSTATEDLATHLLRDRPGGLSKAIFVNSGSEATDAALKLAFQYWREAGQPQRRVVIARKQSYHGNTIGALCVSGHDARRAMYSDWMSTNVRFVDPCFAYRFNRQGESDEMYVRRLSEQLEAQIIELGPGNVAAFIAETVSGSTLGCATPTEGYFKAVRALCDKYDILLILDEVSERNFYILVLKRLIWLTLFCRLCVAWARLALCMRGSRRESEGRTSRPSVKLLEVASFHSQECCYIRKSLIRLRRVPGRWLMGTRSR